MTDCNKLICTCATLKRIMQKNIAKQQDTNKHQVLFQYKNKVQLYCIHVPSISNTDMIATTSAAAAATKQQQQQLFHAMKQQRWHTWSGTSINVKKERFKFINQFTADKGTTTIIAKCSTKLLYWLAPQKFCCANTIQKTQQK